MDWFRVGITVFCVGTILMIVSILALGLNEMSKFRDKCEALHGIVVQGKYDNRVCVALSSIIEVK